MEQPKKEKFTPPSAVIRKSALGSLKGYEKTLGGSLDSIDKYWTQIKAPSSGDWLYPYGHKGQTFDNFNGKKVTPDRNVLHIQP